MIMFGYIVALFNLIGIANLFVQPDLCWKLLGLANAVALIITLFVLADLKRSGDY